LVYADVFGRVDNVGIMWVW